LDEDTLKNIAKETGGTYINASNEKFGLEQIYNDYLVSIERHQVKDKREKIYNERFQIFLAAALLLLLITVFSGGGKHNE